MSQKLTEKVQSYITNPVHGGKVTCRKCSCFISEGTGGKSMDTDNGHWVWFCEEHWNRYEHYYDLDKPID